MKARLFSPQLRRFGRARCACGRRCASQQRPARIRHRTPPGSSPPEAVSQDGLLCCPLLPASASQASSSQEHLSRLCSRPRQLACERSLPDIGTGHWCRRRSLLLYSGTRAAVAPAAGAGWLGGLSSAACTARSVRGRRRVAAAGGCDGWRGARDG